MGIIVGILGLLFGLPQIAGKNWVQIWRLVVRGRISWEEVHKVVCDSIAHELEKCDLVPDLIVGVGRGGLICAGLLCSELTGEELERNGQAVQHTTRIRLASIDTKATLRFVDRTSASRSYSVEEIQVGEFEETVIGDEKVVLIVAQSFTGATLKEARDKLVAKGIKDENITMISAFLQKVPPTQTVSLTPDISGKVISAKKTMPWKTHKVTTDRF